MTLFEDVKEGVEEAMLFENSEALCKLANKAIQLRSLNPKAKFLLNEYQASIVTGFRVPTLRKRRWQGLPPQFLKVGGNVFYDYFYLQDYLESCVRNSTTQII
jgi:hypothetical protein